MIVTQRNAREILAKHYGDAAKAFKLRTTTQIGIRPVYEVQFGKVQLAWRKLAAGSDSACCVGCVLSDGTIDWDWSPETDMHNAGQPWSWVEDDKLRALV